MDPTESIGRARIACWCGSDRVARRFGDIVGAETAMNIPSRPAFIAATVLLALAALAPQRIEAQTPQQMEYERQQREYRQQQEQHRQEQQRVQQQMNENARRQQEESRRLNAPMGQSPTPGYQGAAPQMAPRQQGVRTDAIAATAAAKWVELGSLPANGGLDIYSDPVTMRRSGDLVQMWEMWDFKTTQVIAAARVLSVKNQYEYDCKSARRRMLSTAGFSGHMGKGAVVGSGNAPEAWGPVGSGNYMEELWKVACGKK